MRLILVAGAALALATSVRAADAPVKLPVQQTASTPAPALAKLEPGLVVKDVTGLTIGEIVQVFPVTENKQIVAIKMDGQVFNFDGANLTFDEGAAYANATRFALRAGLRAALAAQAAEAPAAESVRN